MCRQLGRFSAMCMCVLDGSGFDGFESQLTQCVAIIGLMPLMGRPALPFIRQGKVRGIVEGKGENEKEKKSSRITGSFFSFALVPPTLETSTWTTFHHGLVHHWRHV